MSNENLRSPVLAVAQGSAYRIGQRMLIEMTAGAPEHSRFSVCYWDGTNWIFDDSSTLNSPEDYGYRIIAVHNLPPRTHPRNVLREYISGPACENCRAEASQITEDGVRLCAKCYSECPPEDGPASEDEKHAARHRVMLAESAVAKARQAVIEAEVELAMARSIAASVLSPNVQSEPRSQQNNP